MLKLLRIPLLTLLAVSLVTACDSPEPRQYSLRFTNKTPIHMDVATIEVQSLYKSPQRSPNVEHLFPVPPEQAVKNWVNDRLKSIGGRNRLVIIINDASVVENFLPTTQGIKGTFTKDQKSKLEASVVVEARIYGDRNVSLAGTEVRATRFTTVPERLSITERNDLNHRLVRALMSDLNAELEKNFHQYFSQYIHYSHPG